jgi:hypothetical protein
MRADERPRGGWEGDGKCTGRIEIEVEFAPGERMEPQTRNRVSKSLGGGRFLSSHRIRARRKDGASDERLCVQEFGRRQIPFQPLKRAMRNSRCVNAVNEVNSSPSDEKQIRLNTQCRPSWFLKSSPSHFLLSISSYYTWSSNS